MINLKIRWATVFDRYSDDDAGQDTPAQATTSTAPSDTPPVHNTADVPDVVPNDVYDLPIHEAPAAMIDYWHAYGSNGFLQMLLREYDLDFYHNVHAYDHFKIGMNEATHEATFALDDEHYCTITFNAKHTAPLDRQQAYRVLEFINRLREETRHYEDFCGVMVERFDEAN